MILLDSFALLAYLLGQAGERRVSEILDQALPRTRSQDFILIALSLINLGEVLYIIERRRGILAAQEVLAAVQQLPIQILEVDSRQVFRAAHIKANFPISYADAFAVAVAQEHSATLLTGDPEFKAVEGLIQVEWLGY